VTPVRLDLVRSDLAKLSEIDWERAAMLIDELAREALAALAEAGCGTRDVTFVFGADLRYSGQQHEVTLLLDADPREHRDAGRIARAFEEAYRQLYGVNPSHVPIELVTWRLTARGPITPFHSTTEPALSAGAPKTWRAVHAWAEDMRVPVYARQELGQGQALEGPAIIEERETTTVLPPGWTATIDRIGCIIATAGGEIGEAPGLRQNRIVRERMNTCVS
jgi:N-methylhydantoinase A